jgi:hypothetical protein
LSAGETDRRPIPSISPPMTRSRPDGIVFRSSSRNWPQKIQALPESSVPTCVPNECPPVDLALEQFDERKVRRASPGPRIVDYGCPLTRQMMRAPARRECPPWCWTPGSTSKAMPTWMIEVACEARRNRIASVGALNL